MSWFAAHVVLVVAVFGLLGAVNAVRPPANHRRPGARPPWILVMLTAELVPTRIVTRSLLLGAAWRLGAFEVFAGRVGLWLTGATWILYLGVLRSAAGAGRVVRAALVEAGVPPRRAGRLHPGRILFPFPYRMPSRVARRTYDYAPALAADVYRARDHRRPAPALIHVHGGGWRGGNRRQQARPLIHTMAERGWVVIAVDYPLVPAATFPDQLVALRAALAWTRREAEDLGVDPRRLFVTGTSAGAHLAALLALDDTAVAGAVVLYGIYDLLNRNHTRDPWPVVPRGLMKSRPADDLERWKRASPLDQVGPHAPPFFVLHGASDSLVPAAESRQFVAALREVSQAAVAYAELPGATHAFDVMPSLRTQLTIQGVAAFLEHVAAPADRAGGSAGELTPGRARRLDVLRAGSPRRSSWRRGRPSA